MKLLILAAAGGAIGAAGRYAVNAGALRLFGPQFPWGTLLVNVAGSFAMGLLVALLALRTGTTTELRTFVAVGILGGFTTFSAFSLDAVALYERGEFFAAFGYVLASVVLSILGLVLGLGIGRVAWS